METEVETEPEAAWLSVIGVPANEPSWHLIGDSIPRVPPRSQPYPTQGTVAPPLELYRVVYLGVGIDLNNLSFSLWRCAATASICLTCDNTGLRRRGESTGDRTQPPSHWTSPEHPGMLKRTSSQVKSVIKSTVIPDQLLYSLHLYPLLPVRMSDVPQEDIQAIRIS